MNVDIEQARKRAKELVKSGDAETLAGAQLQIARQLGYESWPKLVHSVVGWKPTATCAFCGLPKGDREVWRVGDWRAIDPEMDPDFMFVHEDCFMAMENDPRLAAVGVDAAAGPGDKLTTAVKRLLVGAANVAQEFGHDFVGVEHILLAMVRTPPSLAGWVLEEVAGRAELERELTARLVSEEYNGPLRRADE